MYTLPELLRAFQSRAGMWPESKELLPPLLSVFPKANHIGNPLLRCSEALYVVR